MKHAGAAALARLDSVLAELRQLPGLSERKPGIFYRRSQAFIHFHEDPAGLFADARLQGSAFERFGLSSPEDTQRFLRAVRAAIEV